MSDVVAQPSTKLAAASTRTTQSKPVWLVIGVSLLLLIAFMPTPPGLSTAGQRVLGVLAFAVIMWISEAIPYVYTAFASILCLAVFLRHKEQPAPFWEHLRLFS